MSEAIVDPGMRVSDADRERVAAELQEHVATGRLTIAEFAERVGAVYRARTAGELQPVTSDLPAVGQGRRLSPAGVAAAAIVVVVVLLVGLVLAPGAAGLGTLAAQMRAMCGMG